MAVHTGTGMPSFYVAYSMKLFWKRLLPRMVDITRLIVGPFFLDATP
jgi:hypothetical protein